VTAILCPLQSDSDSDSDSDTRPDLDPGAPTRVLCGASKEELPVAARGSYGTHEAGYCPGPNRGCHHRYRATGALGGPFDCHLHAVETYLQVDLLLSPRETTRTKETGAPMLGGSWVFPEMRHRPRVALPRLAAHPSS